MKFSKRYLLALAAGLGLVLVSAYLIIWFRILAANATAVSTTTLQSIVLLTWFSYLLGSLLTGHLAPRTGWQAGLTLGVIIVAAILARDAALLVNPEWLLPAQVITDDMPQRARDMLVNHLAMGIILIALTTTGGWLGPRLTAREPIRSARPSQPLAPENH